MKRFTSFAVTLLLVFCSFGTVLATGSAKTTLPNGAEVIVDAPAQEILISDPYGSLFYNAANEYYLTNGLTATVRMTLPDGVSADRCWIMTAYDWWEPHYFTDLTFEDGYYVYTANVDSLETTGICFTDFQIYYDQDYNPGPGGHYPDWIINLYSSEADLDSFCTDFEGVTWEYPVVEDDLSAALNAEGCSNVFASEGDYVWAVDAETYAPLVTAVTTNAGANSTECKVSTSVTLNAGDVISFNYFTSTEADYDEFIFSVNGEEILHDSGLSDEWESYLMVVDADGAYELSWAYVKDSSWGGNDDACWLDEVYTGAPVEVSAIDVVPALEVPLYRTSEVTYTVLPSNATDKSVVFTSSDESVAVVDEDGVVTGVSLGTATITVSSVANPAVYGECIVTVVDSGIVPITFYAACVHDFNYTFDDSWISFPVTDVTDVTVLGQFPVYDNVPWAYAAAYAYGTVYGFELPDHGAASSPPLPMI